MYSFFMVKLTKTEDLVERNHVEKRNMVKIVIVSFSLRPIVLVPVTRYIVTATAGRRALKTPRIHKKLCMNVYDDILWKFERLPVHVYNFSTPSPKFYSSCPTRFCDGFDSYFPGRHKSATL